MFKKKQAPQPERRRPISGPPQAPSAAFSYRAARSVRQDAARDTDRPDETALAARRKRRRSLLSNARVIGVTLAIVLFAVLDLMLGTTPKVVETGDSSGQIFLRSSAAYAAAADKLFAGSMFNRNKVTVDAKQISADMLREFPELTAVNVSLPFVGSQPVMYIQPATPKLILATQGSGTLVIDNEGRALINTSQVAGISKLQLPTVTDQSGLSVQVGKSALTAANVSFITEVVGQLSAKGVTITSLTLPAASSELDVHVIGANYFIKFNLAVTDARQEAGTYLAVRNYLASHKQTPLAYVDVRVPGRAYYK